MAPRAQASVILVGELPEQLTGSRCCGKLVGDNTHFEGGVFAAGRVPSYAEIAEHLPDGALEPDTPVNSA
jgi:hypothetical protein